MTKKASLFLVIVFGIYSNGFGVDQKGTSVTKEPVENARVPDSYKKRISRFNSMIAQEPNRVALIKTAIGWSKNPKSEYRIDAINLLADVKAKAALQDLMVISQDREVRAFAIYAIGEMPSEKSIPLLISYLDDPDDNVRGNSIGALQKITGMRFRYEYASSGERRKKGIEDVTNWWGLNKTNFVVKEQTPEEKKAAEDAWEKFGRQYITDLSR